MKSNQKTAFNLHGYTTIKKGAPPPEPAPRRWRGRIAAAPQGGLLAECGFYATAMQKVVRRWKGRIGDAALTDIYLAVAMTVLNEKQRADLPLADIEREAFFELAFKMTAWLQNKTDLQAWLMRLSHDVAVNGEWPSWDDVVRDIQRQGGPRFTPYAVKQAAQRMRLLTPTGMAADFRKAVW